MYNKLQYVSQGSSVQEQLYNIHKALDNGCDWIQLRFKKAPTLDLFALAEAAKFLCEEYLANFIINDNVYLAQQLATDGVHLGLQDMSITEARTLLGKTKIIGGTANTFKEVVQRTNEGCDYIGLGPFRFTETKSDLSPVLNFEGFQNILKQMQSQNIKTPVYAIGGIQLEDIEKLMQTGIHGIALSALITQAKNQKKIITQLHEKLYVNI